MSDSALHRLLTFLITRRAHTLLACGLLIWLVAPTRASTVLVIAPDAGPGTSAFSGEIADALVDALRQSPGIQAGLFDPSSPAIKFALRRHNLAPQEVKSPNEFTSALHLGLIYGANYVVYGTVRQGLQQNGGVQLSLGDLAANSFSLLPIQAGIGGTQASGDVARQAAALILQRIAPPAATGTAPGEEHWRQAQSLLAGGEKDDALRELMAAVQAAPDNGKYRAGLAGLLLRQGEVARAVALYQDAATESPFDADIRLELGRALEEHGDNAEALAAFEEAARLAPDRPEIHLALGRALLRKGDGKRALSELQIASRNPALITANHQANDLAEDLAAAMALSGDTAGAEAALEKLIASDPHRSAPRERLAALQLNAGHPDAAIGTLLAGIRAGAAPGVEGTLVAESAVDAELRDLIPRLPAAAGADLDALRTRAEAAAALADGLPETPGAPASKRRRSAAAGDVLQAITELQHPGVDRAGTGDAAVLLAQARRILGLSAAKS